MLVLSRKTGQQIYIGDDIVITVTEIKGNRVKIGIDAPDTYRILRGEVQPDGTLHILSDETSEKPKDDSPKPLERHSRRKRKGSGYHHGTNQRRQPDQRRDAS